MNYKQMTTKELTLHILNNRRDKKAYNELRIRDGKKIVIPANVSIREQTQILKQLIK